MMDYRSYQQRFTDALAKQERATFFTGEQQNRAALAIYRNNVIYSLREVLSADFPVVKKILGEEFFNHIAGDFVRAHLPRAADLSRYGTGFADFIQHNEALNDMPYLSDVARIEEVSHEVYYAPTETFLDRKSLQAMEDEELSLEKFTLRASARVLKLDWTADEIWHAHQQKEIPALVATPEEIFLLLHKKGTDIDIFRLNKDIAYFLLRFDGATTLEQATQATLKEFPRFDLANGLSLCLSKHLLK